MDDLDIRLRDAMRDAVGGVATPADAWARNQQLLHRRTRRRPVYAVAAAAAGVVVVAGGISAWHSFATTGARHAHETEPAAPGISAPAESLTSPATLALAQRCATTAHAQKGNLSQMPALTEPAANYAPILVTTNEHPPAGTKVSDVVAIRAADNPQTVVCQLHPGTPQAVEVIYLNPAPATAGWISDPIDFGTEGSSADGVSTFTAEGRAVSSVASIVVTDPSGGKHDALISGGVWWADGAYNGTPSSGHGLVVDAYDANGNLLYDSTRDDGYKAKPGACWRLPEGRVLNAAGWATADAPGCKTGYPWPS